MLKSVMQFQTDYLSRTERFELFNHTLYPNVSRSRLIRSYHFIWLIRLCDYQIEAPVRDRPVP